MVWVRLDKDKWKTRRRIYLWNVHFVVKVKAV